MQCVAQQHYRVIVNRKSSFFFHTGGPPNQQSILQSYEQPAIAKLLAISSLRECVWFSVFVCYVCVTTWKGRPCRRHREVWALLCIYWWSQVAGSAEAPWAQPAMPAAPWELQPPPASDPSLHLLQRSPSETHGHIFNSWCDQVILQRKTIYSWRNGEVL